MDQSLEIVNRVAQSGLISLDLEELVPDKSEESLDIKDQLFQGLMLREKDFRAWVKENDWSVYKDSYVAIYCSADAIVPTWAYMLITAALEPYTSECFFCNPRSLSALVAEKYLNLVEVEQYKDCRVVIKGCGHREISNHAYVKLTTMLLPYAKTVMFGEPCSTVPVFKRK